MIGDVGMARTVLNFYLCGGRSLYSKVAPIGQILASRNSRPLLLRIQKRLVESLSVVGEIESDGLHQVR